MAFSIRKRLLVLAANAICLSIFYSNIGKAQYGSDTGNQVFDPAQIAARALLCFNNRNIYRRCDESYRLTMSGELNVPFEVVDEYCDGPCLEETYLMLDCIDNMMSNFVFYNRATARDVRDTVNAACGYGPERGNFNVYRHMRYYNSANKPGNWMLFGLALTSIVCQLLL